jgi:hypothetical protein
MKRRKLWIALGALALLTPLGLWLPERFGGGPAWGEWSVDEIKRLVGYVPAGMKKYSELWQAPLPDYSAPRVSPSAGYLLSGLVGAGATAALALVLGRALTRRKRGQREGPPRQAGAPPGAEP